MYPVDKNACIQESLPFLSTIRTISVAIRDSTSLPKEDRCNLAFRKFKKSLKLDQVREDLSFVCWDRKSNLVLEHSKQMLYSRATPRPQSNLKAENSAPLAQLTLGNVSLVRSTILILLCPLHTPLGIYSEGRVG